jgi:tetratricopeptide (TPR) repeat protein
VLKDEPLQILALISMGNAYNWLNDYAKAEQYFQRALEIDPHNEYALAELGTVYLNKGEMEKSKALLGESLKINHTSYSCPYEGLGLLYLKQGNLQEAEANFQKAIQINPDIEYRKYNGLAKIYIKEGKLKEAKQLLLKSIENYPGDKEAGELLKELEKNR